MITISREPFPHAAYLRVIGIRRDAYENSANTWATLDDLGTITKVGTDTIVEKNNHDVLVFRKDGTIRLDRNGHPADRKKMESLKAVLCSAHHRKTALIWAKMATFTPKMIPSLELVPIRTAVHLYGMRMWMARSASGRFIMIIR